MLLWIFLGLCRQICGFVGLGVLGVVFDKIMKEYEVKDIYGAIKIYKKCRNICRTT